VHNKNAGKKNKKQMQGGFPQITTEKASGFFPCFVFLVVPQFLHFFLLDSAQKFIAMMS